MVRPHPPPPPPPPSGHEPRLRQRVSAHSFSPPPPPRAVSSLARGVRCRRRSPCVHHSVIGDDGACRPAAAGRPPDRPPRVSSVRLPPFAYAFWRTLARSRQPTRRRHAYAVVSSSLVQAAPQSRSHSFPRKILMRYGGGGCGSGGGGSGAGRGRQRRVRSSERLGPRRRRRRRRRRQQQQRMRV